MNCIDPRILIVIDELELLLLILAELKALIAFLHSAYLRLVLLDEVLSLLELRRLGILAQFHGVLELRQVLDTRCLIERIAVLMLEQLLRGGEVDERVFEALARLVVLELDVLFEFDRRLEYCALGSASYLQVVEHVDRLLLGLYLRRAARRVLFPVDLGRVEVAVLLRLRAWLELRLLPHVLTEVSPVVRRIWSEEFALPAGGERLQLRGSIGGHSAASSVVVHG